MQLVQRDCQPPNPAGSIAANGAVRSDAWRYTKTIISNLASDASAGRRGSLVVHQSNAWRRWAIALGCTLLGNISAWAQTTWTGAVNGNWSNAGNWTAGVPASNNNPTFMSDVIMLGPGNTTNTADFWPYTLNTLQFPLGAPSFLIHIKNVTLTGPGVINASGVVQTLEVDAGHVQGAILDFGNSTFGASVAGSVQINNDGSAISGDDPSSGGSTTFFRTSSADQATINNNAAQASDTGVGNTNFRDHSTAGNATINNLGGGAPGFNGGRTDFFDNSSAGSATIINFAAPPNGDIASGFAGTTRFDDSSHAANATIVNQGSSAFLPSFSAGFTDFTSLSSAENATITNQAGGTEAGLTQFDGAATAANAVINNMGGDSVAVLGGETRFLNVSAGNATINNDASAAPSASGGLTRFFGGTAGNATINNNGGFASSQGGQTQFLSDATAGGATIINNGGGLGFGQGGKTIFSGASSAGAATLIADAGAPPVGGGGVIIVGGLGGSIIFGDNSSGGTSRVEVFGNGGVDISGHGSPGVTIGSLEGDGAAFLGANNLTIGSNNRSTNFSGVAQDGGASGGVGGSLTKIGAGTLTLSGASTYTGTTTVSAGKLVVDGSIAASSRVTVNAGATLAGHGSVSNIGGAGAVSPGNSPGILTASQVSPSGGMSFSFDFTKAGSPIYSDAASSGNSLLHLTGTTPFMTALTSANEITVDFSGASLAAGELFRGGFFTDTSTLTSMVSGADFLYTGTDGFTVNFDGFVTEPMAAFAGGTVVDGTVLEFDISGTGTGGGGGAAVPEPATFSLLALGLAGLGFVHLRARRAQSRIETS